MKTTKTFFALLMLLVCSMSAVAQSSYEKKMKQYMELNGGLEIMKSDMMKNALMQIHDAIVGEKKVKPNKKNKEKAVDLYLQTSLADDMASLLSTYTKNDISEADLDGIIAKLSTPEGKKAVKNTTRMSSDECMSKIVPDIQAAMQDIVNGKTPKTVKAQVTKARRDKFNTYWKVSSMGALASQMATAIFGTVEVSEDVKAKAVDWFNANMPEMMLIAAEGVVDDADFDTYIDLCKTTAYQRVVASVTKILNNPMQIGMAIVEKYGAWLEK